MRNRLVQHSKDGNEDFRERTCAVTSKDQNVAKAHARHLECRLIAIANAVGIVAVVNGTVQPPVLLPGADESDTEFFFDQLRPIRPVLGLDFVRFHEVAARTTTDAAPLFQLASRKHGLEAQAFEIDGEFVVLAGSDAAMDWSSISDRSYSRRHAQLIRSRQLAPAEKGRRRFAEDAAFRSPSAASAVFLERPDDGRASWKVGGTKTLPTGTGSPNKRPGHRPKHRMPIMMAGP